MASSSVYRLLKPESSLNLHSQVHNNTSPSTESLLSGPEQQHQTSPTGHPRAPGPRDVGGIHQGIAPTSHGSQDYVLCWLKSAARRMSNMSTYLYICPYTCDLAMLKRPWQHAAASRLLVGPEQVVDSNERTTIDLHTCCGGSNGKAVDLCV